MVHCLINFSIGFDVLLILIDYCKSYEYDTSVVTTNSQETITTAPNRFKPNPKNSELFHNGLLEYY
jgi:hypothetical protein